MCAHIFKNQIKSKDQYHIYFFTSPYFDLSFVIYESLLKEYIDTSILLFSHVFFFIYWFWKELIAVVYENNEENKKDALKK